MKSDLARLLLACAAAIIAVSISALDRRELGNKTGLMNKFYAAETRGDTQIQSGNKIHTARHAIAFAALEQKVEQCLDSSPPTEVTAASGVTKADSTEIQNSATTSAEASQEVMANSVVSAQLPINAVVSLDRLQGSEEQRPVLS